MYNSSFYKSKVGKIGEDLACYYLENKGYKTLYRNFRKKWGEIDIISKSPDGVLIFVEVKTIQNSGNAAMEILPEENLTNAKISKLKRSAMLFAGSNQDLIDEKKGWRIDLVAITLSDKENKINHYENI